MARDNDTYGFNRQDAEEMIDRLIDEEAEPLQSTIQMVHQSLIAYTPVGGIAARSGSSVSSATCTIYELDSGSLSATTDTISVNNLSTTAVAGEVYIFAVQETRSGEFIAVWEDC